MAVHRPEYEAPRLVNAPKQATRRTIPVIQDGFPTLSTERKAGRSSAPAQKSQAARKPAGAPGTQTLTRGLEVVDAVANGASTLVDLEAALGLTRSTTHRLATTLVERRYLDYSRRDGYSLGPKLLELGYMAGQSKDLPRVAREYLEELSARTNDTVHLGVLDGTRALYLDKIPGSRRVEIRSRVGERQPLRSTGLGKALILDADETQWREFYDQEARLGNRYEVPLDEWLRRMHEYARQGHAFDLEENEDRVRCVAAPVRGVDGSIVGAISVSSAAQYMDDVRMRGLAFDVCRTAGAISSALGFNPANPRVARRLGKR
jgi:DNA-binding IclR family transcriptional regulator